MPRSGDPETIEFETMYKKLLRGRFGNALIPDVDALGFCKELVQSAERGDVPHGGEMNHVVPASLDYTQDATIMAVTNSAASLRPLGLSLPQLALLAALAVVFVGYVVMTLTNGNSARARIESSVTLTPIVANIEVSKAAASPTLTPTPTLLPAPTVPAGFVTVAGERLPEVWPTTLELGGRSFLVYVAPVRDGNWLVRQEAGIANWVPGSIINWSFAIYVDPGSDPDAPDWLARMQQGTTAVLRVSDGRARRFNINDKREINRAQTEFLDPHRPGLTVVIKEKPGDTRLLLRGTELSASATDTNPMGATPVSPTMLPGP